MTRIEILEQVRRYGRGVKELPGGFIKIEGEVPMTEEHASYWCEQQKVAQCPECGAYRTEQNLARIEALRSKDKR